MTTKEILDRLSRIGQLAGRAHGALTRKQKADKSAYFAGVNMRTGATLLQYRTAAAHAEVEYLDALHELCNLLADSAVFQSKVE